MTNNPYTGKARYDAWNEGYASPNISFSPYTGDARSQAFRKGQAARRADDARPTTEKA